MRISARVQNSLGRNKIELKTGDQSHSIVIAPRSSGYGSSANGGELLCLALAACYCNDVYRQAAKRKVTVESVEVEVESEFGAEVEPGKNVSYRARVVARASEATIRELMTSTDTLAEIHNTLRVATPVVLSQTEAIPA